MYFLPIVINLGQGDVKSINVKDQLILDPVLKFIDGRWTSAIFDIEVTYNDDLTIARLENKSDCSGVMKIMLRTIHVSRIRS